MKKRLAVTAVAALLLAACSQPTDFTVLSNPHGAEITINGKPVGITPVVTKVAQDKNLAIVAYKPGYQSASKTIPTKTNWWRTLLWTKHDPKAQYLEETSVTFNLSPIPSAANYTRSQMPVYTGGVKPQQPVKSEAPSLRPMPSL